MRATPVHQGHTGAVHALVEAHGSLLSGGADGRVLGWDPRTPETVKLIAQVPSPVYSLLHVPTQQLLLIGTSTGELFVLDLLHRQVVHRYTAHTSGLFAFALLPGERVATAGGDGTLSIWELTNTTDRRCSLLRAIPLCDAKVRGLAVAPEGTELAVACGDGAVRILETTLFNEVATCTGHAGGSNSVYYHHNKPVLVSGGKDGHLRTWNRTDGYVELLALPAHRSTIYAISFNPGGRRMASASRDKTVKLWEAHSMEPVAKGANGLHGHNHSVNAACWFDAGLFTAGDDRKVLRWETSS